MSNNTTPRQAALWFASKDYAVLPLHSVTEHSACTCGSKECSVGKHPYAPLAPHGLKDATTNLDTVRAWFDEATTLYNSWKERCEANGECAGSLKAFGLRIIELGLPTHKTERGRVLLGRKLRV